MKRAVVLLFLLAVPSRVEAAITLDFEALRVDDAAIHDHSGVLEFEGFRITSVPPPGNSFRYSTAGTLNPLFAGSTALFNGQSNAENVLTMISGDAFTISSIDLAVLPPGALDPNGPFDPGPFDLTFTGTLAAGGTVSNTFTINNTFLALETFHFTGFDVVVSVSWFQGSGWNPSGPAPLPGEPTHQFDNIVVTPVCEPASLTMLLGLTVIVIASRFRLGRMDKDSAAPC